MRSRRKRTGWVTGILLVALVLALLVPALAAAATAGPEYGTGTSAFVAGASTDWVGAGNIGADGSPYATCTGIPYNNATSYLLFAKDLGFAIPAKATIQGIEVQINRHKDNTTFLRDHTVRLTKNGTDLVGSNLAVTATNWPTSFATATYGGSANMLGRPGFHVG